VLYALRKNNTTMFFREDSSFFELLQHSKEKNMHSVCPVLLGQNSCHSPMQLYTNVDILRQALEETERLGMTCNAKSAF
jgi:hypothetical protein